MRILFSSLGDYKFEYWQCPKCGWDFEQYILPEQECYEKYCNTSGTYSNIETWICAECGTQFSFTIV